MAVDTKGSKNTIQGDAKVIQVDYSNDASIKHALTGMDAVISTIPDAAFDVQWKIAAAAKEVDVKLFFPSEFGGKSEGKTEGIDVEKARVQVQLKALGLPYTAFYTGAFADQIWVSYVSPFFVYSILFNHTSKGSYTSISRAGKCPLVAMATSRCLSPPDPMLPDSFPMS